MTWKADDSRWLLVTGLDQNAIYCLLCDKKLVVRDQPFPQHQRGGRMLGSWPAAMQRLVELHFFSREHGEQWNLKRLAE